MRYVIGIDLGTTNSCVAYADILDPKAPVRGFKIPQLAAEGSHDHLPTLPSFCYLAPAHEWPKGSLDLPWSSQAGFFVGSFARFQGTKAPTRLVQSAKSWLCHSAANRRDKILPLEAADESTRISPVEASARYLRHIRDAWNYAMAKGDAEAEFEVQEIILTVPASFDEVARTLTVEAARAAGFEKVTLLEEPQAAFYSWISQHEADWESLIPPGSQILVCDVGGGTTDFSLIEVASERGKASFQRMAVGNHLLLGGDNMDAAVAHYLETKLKEQGHMLSSNQRLQLFHEAREAKEALLPTGKNASVPDHFRVLLQGTGSSVVQGTSAVNLSRTDLQELLYSGFFGQYDWSEALRLKKASGFRTMGLPYESDPSIIRHLAHFLNASATEDNLPKKPDFVLFNGGAMKPHFFQQAVIDNLNKWFPEKSVSVLPSFNHDLAVARGAAYYGKARRGIGVRIGGGMARGYYLVLDAKNSFGEVLKKALTLLPRGSEEGAIFEPADTFWLMPNTPVSFQLCTSHTRLHDTSGDLIAIDPQEMQMLPAIRTVLRFGRRQAGEALQEKIPVRLRIELTPIGTLQISLKSSKTEHTWELEFQVRTASGQDDSLAALSAREADQTFSSNVTRDAEKIVNEVFGNPRSTLKPESLVEKLEVALNMGRKDWPPSVLRGLADALVKAAPHRKASAEHTVRWWNLVGFALRPGFGYPLDDFRIKELWKVILSDFKGPAIRDVQIQFWICLRRIAGGLSKGQQTQLAGDLATLLTKSGKIEFKSKSEIYPYSEKVRALAALELVDVPFKTRFGQALVARIAGGEGIPAEYWSLGRLGARHLLYGSLVNAIPRETCELWIERLLSASLPSDEKLAFLLGQIAGKTEHAEINISTKYLNKILEKFAGSPHAEQMHELLNRQTRLSLIEKEQAFGDCLPAGLLLESNL